ncbi:hypothetical protein [Marinibactrum halimedae]|uniref:Uncharacterized protein n=1 Tax=Marinibactrum halimedae TaxID=1444977 RepID=A0AA37T267_9GAMM|nr:hypothetical protein [Marinibactrum halimedae]MCD9461133.1 hypothetical protein [Marinibactrum halimedae]GLS24639.1 hypothetical protein GCM10007877_03530 [Marinibactrum halimedae]
MMNEPYKTLYMQLMKHNWQHWGRWKFGVKAIQGEAIYIGDDDAHLTILSKVNGYHKTINKITGPQDLTATTLDAIIRKCEVGDAFDITPTINNTLQWFKNNP